MKFLHCGGLWDEKEHPANIGTYFGFIDECQYLSGIVGGPCDQDQKTRLRRRQGDSAGAPQHQRLHHGRPQRRSRRSPARSIFTGDWSLPVKEAEAAINLIDQGVDVMTCHVNSPKVVIEKAERRGIYTCGYHADQAEPGPQGIPDRGRMELGEDLHRLRQQHPRGTMDARPDSRRLEGRLRAHVRLMAPPGTPHAQGRRRRQGQFMERNIRDLQGTVTGQHRQDGDRRREPASRKPRPNWRRWNTSWKASSAAEHVGEHRAASPTGESSTNDGEP